MASQILTIMVHLIKYFVFARRNDEAISMNCSNSDCFVPRNDGTKVKVPRLCEEEHEAISMNCSNSDCFVPYNDGTNIKVLRLCEEERRSNLNELFKLRLLRASQ